jgi:hypothetical protein
MIIELNSKVKIKVELRVAIGEQASPMRAWPRWQIARKHSEVRQRRSDAEAPLLGAQRV